MTTNSEEKLKYLYHLLSDEDEEFFARVDEYGGWPLGMKYVSFFHSGPVGPRKCEFGNDYLRTGWWTTVYSSDDYYWWKISETRKLAFRKQILRELSHELAKRGRAT